MPTNNPMELINFIKQVQNPQQFVYNMIKERSGNNPFFLNLLSLGQQGNEDEIIKIARNAMKEQGRDFDKEFNTFRKNLGF